MTNKLLSICAWAILLQGCNFIVRSANYSTTDTPPTAITAISISPSSATVFLTGESFSFSAAGGQGAYFWSAPGGIGSINSLSGIYSIPLSASPGSDSIKLSDSLGNSTTQSLQIQAFQNQNSLSSPLQGPQILENVNSMAEFSGNLIANVFLVSYLSYTETIKPTLQAIIRSTDDGATWTQIATVQPIPGAVVGYSSLVVIGANIYLVGSINAAKNDAKTFIMKSQDGGTTWSLVYNYALPNTQWQFVSGAVATNDGNYIVYSAYGYNASSSIATVRKCNIATWVCTDSDTTIAPLVNNQIDGLVKDSAGNLYTVSQIFSSSFMSDIIVKKSTDQAQTWSVLRDDANSSLLASTIAVSGDGQSILYAGSSNSVTPYLKESIDGGATWTADTSVCTGWAVVHAIYNPSKDALLTCYNFGFTSPPYTGYVNKKSFGATSWTSVFSRAGGYYGSLFERANGDVILMLPNTLGDEMDSTSDFGATWTTLGYPTPAQEYGDAQFTSILDSGSTLFASGYVTAGTNLRNSVVYRSNDSGVTWLQDLVYSTGDSTLSALTQSPTTQTVIAAGNQGAASWAVYKYDSGTHLWSSSDTYNGASITSINLNQSFADSAGDFFAVGSYIQNPSFVTHWLVRTSTDDAGTWSTLEDYLYVAGFASKAFGGATDGTDVYVVGSGIDASSLSHWLVRKYHGATITLDDDDSFAMGSSAAQANGILKASDGSWYAIGQYTDASSIVHWAVKKKPPGGSWTLVDDYNLSPSTDAAAISIAQDSTGRIFVSGYAKDSLGVQYAIVRAFVHNNWSTVDKYVNYSTGLSQNITPCLGGKVCAAGSTIDNQSMYRGFIRILH